MSSKVSQASANLFLGACLHSCTVSQCQGTAQPHPHITARQTRARGSSQAQPSAKLEIKFSSFTMPSLC